MIFYPFLLSPFHLLAGTTNFKFPYLDAETEKFLYRRKADLESAARFLDNEGARLVFFGSMRAIQLICFVLSLPSCSEASEEMVRTTKHALADAAHVSGMSTKELARRAAHTKSPQRRSTSAGAIRASKEGTAKAREATTPGRGATSSTGKLRAKKDAIPGLDETIPQSQVAHLKAFLQGATAAQRAQITMIRNVFETMDADKDGLLSMSDVRAYFRAVGRNATDLAVRKWIASRDVDQDGAVSLSEFVASYALQLDPASRFLGADGTPDSANQSTAIAEAFGALRLGGTVLETIAACDAIDEYLRRILDSPSVKPFWSISLSEENFHRRIGRMFGGVKLMQALGFVLESNGTVLALRDPKGKEWDVVPQAIRADLNKRLEELSSHRASLLEPSISNIAAGTYVRCLLYRENLT
jgi:hypothetical protein